MNNMNFLNTGMKGIGLALLGIGVFGCIIYPFDYIPSSLYFISEQKPAVVWGILIGLVVIGGVIWYMGMSAEKKKEAEEKAKQ